MIGKRVLIITSDYPPSHESGSIHCSKLTKYLYKDGYKFHILTAPLTRSPKSIALKIEIPPERVTYVPWPDFSNPLNRLLFKLLGNVGWYFPAVQRGIEIVRVFKPHIILAISPHHISQIIGYRLSKIFAIPYIAYLHDPWTIDPHFSKLRLTHILGVLMEKKIFSSASAMIVVSEGYANFYTQLSGRPVYIVHLGFDPDDFPRNLPLSPTFTLFYAGSLYRGARDITPLFTALNNLQTKGVLEHFPLVVKMFLPSDSLEVVLSYFEKYTSIKEIFHLSSWAPRYTVLQEECRATYLLLPLEFNIHSWYAYPGKLFEYMGARRPILSIGSKYNLAAKLIEKLGIGRNCETAEEVEEFLLRELKNFYIEHKTEQIEWEKVKEFSWENQARKIGEILEKYAQ